MNDTENQAIVASSRTVPVYSINTPIIAAKETALSNSALIARVTGHDSKVLAVRAQKELKTIVAAVEKMRVQEKEPLLQAGRQLDNLCKAFVLDLEKEFGRISEVVREFDDAERRRVQEEQRLQQQELERIQREKDAEIERLRKEQEAKEVEARRIQDEKDRQVREAKERADALAREAVNAKQRKIAQEASEAAERDRLAFEQENARLAAAQARQRAELEQRTSQIEEKASDAAFVAARPVEITRVAGQVTRGVWEITKINDWALIKARPDLVSKIEWDTRALKAELARGVKLPGVEAREIFKADVRAGRMQEAIDITP
jgi:hypothetical protein